MSRASYGVGVNVGVVSSVGVELASAVDADVGAVVTLPVGVGLTAPTLITTVRSGPKGWLLSSSKAQTPVNLPVLLGTFIATEISTFCPGATVLARYTVCPPIASP